MKFSLITSTLNVAQRLPRTLDSILTQSYDDFEIIIIDGASADGTQNVILEYYEKFDGRLKWISEGDTGIYNALNKGIKISSGDFLNVIGAGDWLEPNALNNAFECIQKSPTPDAVYGKTRIWDRHLRTNYLVQTSPKVLPIQPMQHPSLFYRQNLHNSFGLYNESYQIVSDYLFCLKAFYTGHSIVEPFNAVVSNFVMDGKSATEIDKCAFENQRARKEAGIASLNPIHVLILRLREKLRNILNT